MLVEAFVFGVNQCFPKHGIDFFIFYRGAVFAEVFSNEDTVGTVNFRSFARCGLLDLCKSWRLAEKP